MNIWPLNKISGEEKSNILSQHRHVYNGYRAINPTVPNEQPLYVQDFAKDKEGMVINNKGVTKTYTNFGINESKEKGLCTECGGQLYEGECMECGSKMYEGECTECNEETFEGIYDVNDLKKDNKFDYVEEEDYDDVVYELEIDEKYFEDEEEEEGYDFEPMESAYSDKEEMGEWAAPLLRAAATGAGAELAGRAANYVSSKFESTDPDMESEEELDELAPLASMAARGLGAYAAGKAADYVSSKFESTDLEEEMDDDLKESFKKEKTRIMEMMNRMKVLK